MNKMQRMMCMVMTLTGICFNTYAFEGEMDRLREQARTERVKEEEIRLLVLDLERVKLEAEKKKVMVEAGVSGVFQGKEHDVSRGARPVSPEIVVKNIFIAGIRKEAVLDINGVRTRLIEGEKSGALTLKKVCVDEVVFVYDTQESVVRIQP